MNLFEVKHPINVKKPDLSGSVFNNVNISAATDENVNFAKGDARSKQKTAPKVSK